MCVCVLDVAPPPPYMKIKYADCGILMGLSRYRALLQVGGGQSTLGRERERERDTVTEQGKEEEEERGEALGGNRDR